MVPHFICVCTFSLIIVVLHISNTEAQFSFSVFVNHSEEFFLYHNLSLKQNCRLLFLLILKCYQTNISCEIKPDSSNYELS